MKWPARNRLPRQGSARRRSGFGPAEIKQAHSLASQMTDRPHVFSIDTIEEQPSRNVPLVAAVAASGRHGFRKEVCRTITLVQGFGVEGDAHGGATVQHLYDKAKEPYRPNLRQVHLVEEELILDLNALGFCVAAGDLGENITTRHVRLAELETGAV
jgi:hypothetical protein